MLVLVVGSLSPVWKTQIEFLAPETDHSIATIGDELVLSI